MKRLRFLVAAATALVTLTSGAGATEITDLSTALQNATRFNQDDLQRWSMFSLLGQFSTGYDAIRLESATGSGRPNTRQGSVPFGKGGISGFRTGLSAGGSARNVAAWGSYSYTNFGDSHPTTSMDGNTHSFFLGIDGEVLRKLIAGLSIGVGLTDTTSPVNSGNTDSTGLTIAPYFLYIISNNFDVDLSFGGTFTNNDNERTAAGVLITSDSNSFTSFVSTHVNYTRWVGRWKFSGTSGVTFSNTRSHDYTDSIGTPVPGLVTKIGTLEVGGRVLYYWKSVQPYIQGRFEYDFRRTRVLVGAGQAVPPNDRTGFVVGGGVNFVLAKNITGGVSGNVTLGRENLDNYTIGANLRLAFGGTK